MSYSYYQQAGTPGWGTNQFQFGPPPAPAFQPQPTWGGHDFFRAHAGNVGADPGLFDQAWSRARSDYEDEGSGVGLHEARHWHRRAYGGLGDLGQMHPSEIGHAAAYEAYRTWIHNSSMREPLSGDMERQREGLAGLAVAEAARLLQYTPRGMDQYARVQASEAAATTASILFYSGRERDRHDEYRGRSSSRHHDSYSEYDDPYALDADAMYPRHRRSHSRHHSRPRSSSHHRSMVAYPPAGAGMAMSHGSVMPGGVPSVAHSAYAGSASPYGTYPGGVVPGGMAPGHAVSYGAPQYAASMGTPPQYAGSLGVPMQYQQTMQGGVPMAMSQPGYSAAPMVVPVHGTHHRSRSSSFSVPYAGTQYANPGQQQYMIAPGVPQSQAVMVSKSHKSHKKHKSKRSKSSEPRFLTF